MTFTVGFTPRALEDLQKVAAWWRANRPSAPRLFQHELELALVHIAAHPEMGANPRLRAYPGARTYVLRRSKYVVLYNVDHEERLVVVARIRHAGRRPLATKR